LGVRERFNLACICVCMSNLIEVYARFGGILSEYRESHKLLNMPEAKDN
jgi:hypothetical protein